MDINDLRDLAIQHGIVILDYEDTDTIRDRIAEETGEAEADITNETVLAVARKFNNLHREDCPLLTETEEGASAIDRGMRHAMHDTGLDVDCEDENEEEEV